MQDVVGVGVWDGDVGVDEKLEMCVAGVKKIDALLEEMAANGNSAAVEALAARRRKEQSRVERLMVRKMMEMIDLIMPIWMWT